MRAFAGLVAMLAGAAFLHHAVVHGRFWEYVVALAMSAAGGLAVVSGGSRG